MSRKGSRYRITLTSSAHKDLPRVRIVVRDSDEDAIESGRRELRRYRRTDPANEIYDRWTVWRLGTHGTQGVKIGEELLNVQPSTVESGRNHPRTTRVPGGPNPVGPFNPGS